MRKLKVSLMILPLVLALALAGCEREHINAYGTEEEEEETEQKDSDDEDNGENGGESDDPFDDPHEADDQETNRAALIVAERLNGSWSGPLDVDFYDDAGIHYTGLYTAYMDFAQYSTNTLNGTGLETDYDANGKAVQKAPFTWYVDTGEDRAIYLKFEDRDMVITPYELGDKEFSGTMKTTDGLETDHFTFTRIK